MDSHKIYQDHQIFGSYLAGLWEGLPKGQGHLNRKSRDTYKPTLGFTFGLNQRVLAEKIKTYFELRCPYAFNSNKHRKGSKICSLNVDPMRKAMTLTLLDASALKLFLSLVLPYVKTPKARNLNLVHNQHLPRVRLTKKSLRADAWLTGFCDADGSFGLRQSVTGVVAKHKLTECTFVLTQKQVQALTQTSVKAVFDQISRFLKCRVTHVIMPASKGKPQFKIKATSAKSKKILRAYFDA